MAAPRLSASKYARALFAQALEHKALPACQEGLSGVADLARKSPRLLKALAHPFVPIEEKRGLIKTALGPHATPLLVHFFDLLITKRRMGMLLAIEEAFVDLVDRHAQVEPLKVRTAFALSEPQRKSLQARLEGWMKTKVRLQIAVDASLIGGLVIQSRDRVLDHSLKGQLVKLQKQLCN